MNLVVHMITVVNVVRKLGQTLYTICKNCTLHSHVDCINNINLTNVNNVDLNGVNVTGKIIHLKNDDGEYVSSVDASTVNHNNSSDNINYIPFKNNTTCNVFELNESYKRT